MPDPRLSPDDDLLAALPPAPPSRPHAREAAIAAAMLTFDRVGEAARRPDPAPARGRTGLDRPRLRVLVAAALVLSIGMPMWRTSDHGRPTPVVERPAAVPAVGRPAEPAAAADVTIAPPAALRTSALPAAPSPSAAPAGREDASAELPSRPGATASADAAAPPPTIVPAPAPAPSAVSEASDVANIVVTASRRSENRAAPVAAFARTQDRALEVPADPTACTVADPAREADSCRAVIAAAVPGRARHAVQDGVSLAWRGEIEAAIAAFDRAIEIDPRSAFAYFNRSLLHRRRGDVARADADRARAIALDRRYRTDPF